MMRRVLIANVVLLAIIAVLVLQIATLWWPTEPVGESGGTRASTTRRLDLPNPRRPAAPADLAQSIAAKDLFHDSRSAPVAGVPEQVAAAPPRVLSTVTLIGVAGFGGQREALVRDQTQPKAVWVRLGEEVGGYEVREINARSLILRAPDGEEVTVEINIITAKGAITANVTGPAGVVPTPKKTPDVKARRTPARRSAEIKAKIERLREEARKRRARNQNK